MARFPSSNIEYYRRHKACFGGNIYAGNPKYERPFYSGLALHLVLRSSRATGRNSMLNDSHRNQIKWLIRKQAKRFGVELHRFSNNGNHLHLLVKPGANRSQLQNFLRAVSGLIARLILKAERGRAQKVKFWDARPFSRIVTWGKAFARCAHYIERNILEALGFDGLNDELDEFFRWRKITYSLAKSN